MLVARAHYCCSLRHTAAIVVTFFIVNAFFLLSVYGVHQPSYIHFKTIIFVSSVHNIVVVGWRGKNDVIFLQNNIFFSRALLFVCCIRSVVLLQTLFSSHRFVIRWVFLCGIAECHKSVCVCSAAQCGLGQSAIVMQSITNDLYLRFVIMAE